MFVCYSSSNFLTLFINVWLILHFKILQNNFYIVNAFSINFLDNVNWGEGPPNVNACQQGGGGRKSRKSCQRSLRMPPYNIHIQIFNIVYFGKYTIKWYCYQLHNEDQSIQIQYWISIQISHDWYHYLYISLKNITMKDF